MESVQCGQLSEEPPSRKEITWEIYHYYTLSPYLDNVLTSPTFSFAGLSWNIIMFVEKTSEGKIFLSLKRADTSRLDQLLYCELGIHIDGICHSGIGWLLPEDCERGCYIDVCRRAVLDDKKDIVDTNGALKVICKLSLDRKPVATAACQTESCLMIPSTLSQDFKKLLISGDDSDATIRVKGKDFKVHRGILGARTPVFASMFRANMVEKSSGIVTIDDFEEESFGDFLNFVYTGNLQTLSPQRAISLYTLADKYDVAELRSNCVEFIKNNLSAETLFDIVPIALRHCEEELIRLAICFFRQNVKVIIKTVSWQNFMSENPTVANELLIKAMRDEDEEIESS